MSDNSNEILLQVNLETNNTTKKLTDIQTGITTLGDVVNGLSKFFNVLGTSVTSAITSFTNNTSSLEKFINAINTTNTGVNNSSTSINALANSTNNLNKSISENLEITKKENTENEKKVKLKKDDNDADTKATKANQQKAKELKEQESLLKELNKLKQEEINLKNKASQDSAKHSETIKNLQAEELLNIALKEQLTLKAQLKELKQEIKTNDKERIALENKAIKEQEKALKELLTVEQEEIKAKKAIIDVSKALILGIDSEIKKQQEKIVIGLNLSNTEKQYNNEVRQTIALATEKKNKELELIALETQAIKILEGKATAENFDTKSIQDNTQALKNKQLSLTDLIAKEQEEKALLEATKKARLEAIQGLQANIINSDNLSKAKQSEIKEMQNILAQAKLEKKASQEFILSTTDKINTLKNEQKELDAVTKAYKNQLDTLKNNNVAKISSNTLSSQVVQNLRAEAEALTVIPKKVKDNANAYDYFMDRVKSFTVGSLISSAIRNVTMEIKALFDEATKEFTQLERNVQSIRGMTLDNPQSFGSTSKVIQNVAHETGSTTAGASENIRTIMTAGINDLSEATKVYEQSLVLARTSVSATKTEQQALNEVMNAGIVIMNNYNLKASDLPTVYNQMSVAATKSRLSVGDFAAKMGGLSTVFAPLGVSLHETMALFSVFSNKLATASEADVALRAIAQKYAHPTVQFKKEMIELQAMTKGTLIDLTPSAVKAQGFVNFTKNLMDELGKTGNAQDIVGRMLGLKNATKGFQDLAASIKGGEITKLTAETLNSVDDLQKKTLLLNETFGREIETFKNSFINIFVTALLENKDVLHDIFDMLTTGLRLFFGVLSDLKDIISVFSVEDLVTAFKMLGGVLLVALVPLETVLKSLGFLRILIVNSAKEIGNAVGYALTYIEYLISKAFNFFTFDKKTHDKNAKDLDDWFDKVQISVLNKSEQLVQKVKDKFWSIFDFSKYFTLNDEVIISNKPKDNSQVAEKKEFKAPKSITGSGEFDFNSKLAKEALDDIEKQNMTKKEYSLKKANDIYQEQKTKSTAEYEKAKININKDLEELQVDLKDPKKLEQRKRIEDDIKTLNQQSIYNEQNYRDAQTALDKKYLNEQEKINDDILKEKQDAIKKAEAEYKKRVDDKYQPLINDQKTAINRIDIDNQDKSEVQRLELKNVQLFKLMAIQQEYSGKFKQGSQERSSILKQNSITDLETLDNERKIIKLQQQDRLENAKTSYSNEKALLKRLASEGGFNKDVELNNQNFLDNKRIEKLKVSLLTEKNLTFEQKKTLNKDIQDLEQGVLDNNLERDKIKKQRIIDNNFFEIDQEKIKFNLLVEIGQQSNKAQLENEIETNNKMIAEYQDQISKLDKVKSSDKIDELNKKINPLLNANEVNKYKINDSVFKLQQEQDNKLFNDKQKSLELFRNLQIYSEETLSKELIKINDEKLQALQEQEKAFITTYGANPINEAKKQELQALKDSILDTNNFILLESKKLTDLIYQEEKRKLDIQLGFLDSYSSAFSKFGESLKNVNNDVFSLISSSFNSLSENYNKAIGIFRQIEPIQKQISDNKAKQNTIKPLLDDEIAKYKQTGIPTTKLSNLVNENKKLESDNKLASQQADAVGVMSAVEQVTSMISKGIDIYQKQDEATKKLAQTYQLFGKNSKEVVSAQGEMIESNLEMIKILPGVGDILYKVTRGITDFFGATKSEKEKKDLKDIESATLSYAKTKLNSTANYHETKLELLEIDKQAELKTLSETVSNQEVFEKKKAEIELRYKQKSIEMNRDYYNQLDDLRNQNRALELESMKDDIGNQKYLANITYEDDLKKIQTEFNLTEDEMRASNNEMVLKRKKNAGIKLQNSLNNIDLASADKTISIQKETEKARLNLLEDSLTKKYQLAFLEYQNEKDLALKDRASQKITQEQYLATLNLIELKYQSVRQNIDKEANDKLRGINEKNYNEELKAFESLNKNKTDKLKSELQKQYDILNEYEQKKKDLLESREQDQALKVKRKNQLEIDLTKKKNELLNNGAFYEQNQTNFETGNGLTTGNDTTRKNIINDFDLGKITYLERNQKIQQLALEKQLYYQALLSKYQDPAKRAEINAKIQDATKEYYEYIFDKEREKLDEEERLAKKKIVTLKKELSEREKIEAEYITMLDSKYKDSALQYKTAFVDATRDWIAFAQQETMQKLGIDAFKQLEKTAINLADNKREAQKYMGSIPTTSPTSSSSVSIPNNQQTNSTQNNIDANTNRNNTGFVYGPFDRPKDLVIPIQVQPSTIGGAILDQQQKQKILANIYSQMGSSYYTQAERMTNSELIAFADKYNIPKFARGGVKNRGQMALVNEVEEEAFFNNSQMQNMYDYVLKNTSNNNVNNNSNINLNLVINAQSTDNKNLSNQISSEVNKSFKTLTDTLARGKK